MGQGMGDREQWSSWFEFFVTTLGYMVGLGNIWRFPYVCYSNGGGAFLLPFLIFLFICAVPLFFLETSYAQFCSLGPGRAWHLCPLFKGVGYGMVTVIAIIAIYYNVIIAWAVYYVFMSLRTVLPWSTCDNEWNTPACTLRSRHTNSTRGFVMYLNVSSAEDTVLYKLLPMTEPQINATTNITTKPKTPTEEFWERHVLDVTDGLEDLGTIRWQLLICHAVAWLIVFFCAIKGIKSFGKVAYVTAIAPYVFLIVLLIRGALLPGAVVGLKYYLIPQWHKLLNIKVWTAAAIQVFFSVGCGAGGAVTLASYNKFNNNTLRDAFIFPILDAFTCILGGLVIFVVLGYMSHVTGLPIESVVAEGPGIAFMVYPEALAQLPLAPMWSTFFFLVLFMVGLDSQFVHVEIVVACLGDAFPNHVRKRKMLVTVIIIVTGFVLALPCTTQGGIYVLQIMDWYAAAISFLLFSFCELIAVSHVYGVGRFYKDIELMVGFRPWSLLWTPLWICITPLLILFLLLSNLVMHQPVKYGTYEYPVYALVVGWIIAILPILPIPVFAIHELLTKNGGIVERFKKAAQPSQEWGPAKESDRQRYWHSLEGDNGKFVGCFGLIPGGPRCMDNVMCMEYQTEKMMQQ